MKIKILLCGLIIMFSYVFSYANEKNNEDYDLVKLEDDAIIILEGNPNIISQAPRKTSGQNRSSGDNYNILQDAFTLYTEGNLSLLNNEYEDAINFYTRSIELNPTVNSYYNMGLTYSRMAARLMDNNSKKPLYEKSIIHYTSAIRLNPNDSFLYNNRGVIYAKLGSFDKAKKDFYKARELSPNDLDIRKNISRLNSDMN